MEVILACTFMNKKAARSRVRVCLCVFESLFAYCYLLQCYVIVMMMIVN